MLADLVAFEVEGSGTYLVPLAVLAPYAVPALRAAVEGTPIGWGWALPVVRWNSFHASQIGLEVALAPGVVVVLAPHHFTADVPVPEPRHLAPGPGPHHSLTHSTEGTTS